MALVPVHTLLSASAAGRYALGYFESWNFESLAGTIDAVEESRSPGIIGFNGEFLTRADRRCPERLSWYAALGREAAERASVPCALIFNECSNDDRVREACDLGFNLVMPADSSADATEYKRRVRDLAGYAHARGVAVEAEVGELPEGGAVHGSVTDPLEAARFVEETGVDLLAVSVGNIHILTKGKHPLDLDLLDRIRRVVDVPLVLHGGTGIHEDCLREAVRLGVRKVNFGTYLKLLSIKTLREALAGEADNPHEVFGLGGDRDAMAAVRNTVKEAILERLPALGCEGKADAL